MRAGSGPIWRDRWSVLLLLGAIALNAGLYAALWQRFDTFPELIAMHFNVYGEVDSIAAKSEIYRIPIFGLIIWAGNAAIATAIVRRDHVLARTALGMALAVLVLFSLAAWRIVS
ncbi:MAG: DUF1648 domain-containing protein [Chloroflexi bacterium]|nr:DUF1648 domain-containing protein [Chloroflexota bacterium]